MLRNASQALRKGVTELAQYPKPGEKLHGFTLQRCKHVPELQLLALHLQHDKTGADYLHVARDDANNVFSIGFKTNPPDATGVPHILEHTTLCGSDKYPIRDPFFKMLPRTLSNYMNAFTASDHTFYPFATTNQQDFKNLMSVYLDATLHPLLKENDFAQEGWRIGPENPEAQDSKLVFKGVVYNEMKGQMSDASYLFYIRYQDHIFPAINNSGGDPQQMTELTYAQLKNFHAEHYHPSNAKVFTYGDMPLSDHLREVNAQLSAFERITSDVELRRPVDLSTGAQSVVVEGPIDPMVDPELQYKTSVSWIMGETKDIVENFSLSIMSALLMDGYGSPLYKALIESGLGTEWSPNAGFDSSGSVSIFSLGLTGVKEADVPKVRGAIRAALMAARETGFDRQKVDGYMHGLEISLKHKTANFGMNLMQRVKPKWFDGVDPFESLKWNDIVAAFEAKMAEGDYLGGLLQKYLLDDKTFTFTMKPSASFGANLVAEESARLANKMAQITERAGSDVRARQQLEEQEKKLVEEQNKSNTQDLSCLPTVYVKDIPRDMQRIDVRESSIDDVKVQWRESPTNGLTYFRAVNVLENLPSELRSLIPLFTSCVNRLGTADMSMEQLEDLMKLKTGGVSVGYHAYTSPTDHRTATEGLVFAGTALDRNVPDMFSILRKLIVETNFDSKDAEKHVRQLLQAAADGVINSIASRGHAYALGYAAAGISTIAQRRQQVSGLEQIKLMTSLATRPEDEGLADIILKLKQIQHIAISSTSNFRAALTCGSESTAQNDTALKSFLFSLPTSSSTTTQSVDPAVYQSLLRNAKTFFPLPYQVYYSALALPTVSYTSPQGAPLQILAQLLTHKHLHHEIREKGGAYGGGAQASATDGIFSFYSYRDPNPQNTIKVIENSGRWAAERKWTDTDLQEAKLSVFQSIDAPKSVSQEGMTRFLMGVSEEQQQERRERLLDVTAEQVKEVAETFVLRGLDSKQGQLVMLGERAPWADEGWKMEEMGVAKPGTEVEDVAAQDSPKSAVAGA